MDTIFIWIVAGAAIGLLGLFLVASERELKNKRRELEELKQGLADLPVPGASNVPTDLVMQENGASAELVARNEKLSQEVSSLSKKLEASESKLQQLETLRTHLNSRESEITELRWECDRLQGELTTLKNSLESNNPQPIELSENTQKDAEIVALREQLTASQARVRDLESIPAESSDSEASQKAFEELQRSLEVSTIQLQNACAAEQEKIKALEATQMQLSEMQQRQHESSAANLRLQEENSRYQQKLTNQNQLQVERLVILRQRLEELRSKQADVSERDRMIQEEIISMSQLLDDGQEYTHQPDPTSSNGEHRHNILAFTGKDSSAMGEPDIIESTSFGEPASELNAPHHDTFDTTNGSSTEPQHHHSPNMAAVAVGMPLTSELSQSGLQKKKRRFGIFSAGMGVLVVGAALSVSFLQTDSEQSSSTAPNPSGSSMAAKIKSQTATAARERKDEYSADRTVRAIPTVSQALPDDSRISRTPDKPTTATPISTKPASNNWESYEVIQSTRVFSAPRGDSQLIANIEPGTQVNVVDSRDGWLEIRSKHGRPPGFIQKTAAVRIGQN